MNIREWFGCFVQYDPSTNFNKSLDGLLELYAQAVTQYFDFDSVTDAQSLIIEATDKRLSTGQSLFLEWLRSKGLSSVQKLASITGVKNEEIAVAEINYEKYILEEEMDFEYPDDVRASLISISNDLASLINEISATIEAHYESVPSQMYNPAVLEGFISFDESVWDISERDVSKVAPDDLEIELDFEYLSNRILNTSWAIPRKLRELSSSMDSIQIDLSDTIIGKDHEIIKKFTIDVNVEKPANKQTSLFFLFFLVYPD